MLQTTSFYFVIVLIVLGSFSGIFIRNNLSFGDVVTCEGFSQYYGGLLSQGPYTPGSAFSELVEMYRELLADCLKELSNQAEDRFKQACENHRQFYLNYLNSNNPNKDQAVIEMLQENLSNCSGTIQKSIPEGLERCGSAKTVIIEDGITLEKPCSPDESGTCPPNHHMEEDGLCWWGEPKPKYDVNVAEEEYDCSKFNTCKNEQKPDVVYKKEDYDFNQPYKRLCQGSVYVLGAACAVISSPSGAGPVVCASTAIGAANLACDWLIPPDMGKKTVTEWHGFTPTCRDWKTSCR